MGPYSVHGGQEADGYGPLPERTDRAGVRSLPRIKQSREMLQDLSIFSPAQDPSAAKRARISSSTSDGSSTVATICSRSSSP